MVFVARKGRGLAQIIDLEGMVVAREPKFLSENLVIFSEGGKGPRYLFIFPRSSGPLVEEIVNYLRARISAPPAAPMELEAQPEPALQT
jgi:hypothetical protein